MHYVEFGACRNRSRDTRNFLLQPVHRGDDIGARLALHIQDDRGLALVPAADARVLKPVRHFGHIAQQHGRAIAIGDNHSAIGGCCGDLVIGGDCVGLLRAVHRAFGARNIRRDDGDP